MAKLGSPGFYSTIQTSCS